MRMFRVRVFLSEAHYNDMVLPGQTCWDAEKIGLALSPVRRANFLGEL
jgi:hypothetical protein